MRKFESLVTGWNMLRWLRLLFGVLIIVQGVIAAQAVWVIAGIALTVLALLKKGCCMAGQCGIPDKGRNDLKENETISRIQYEELKQKS
jgi:hypothetical protein